MQDRDLTIRDDADVATATIAEYERTRREALRHGLALGGTAIAASSVPFLLGVRRAFASGGGDEGIVLGAVQLEQAAVLAYSTAVESGLLSAPVKAVAAKFRDQEQEHAAGLAKALKQLGGKVPQAPTDPSKVKVLKPLSGVKNEADVLTFAVELENMAVMAYSEAHAKLKSHALLATGAQIMSDEGQHLVVLRNALGASLADSVPLAFEDGSSPPPGS